MAITSFVTGKVPLSVTYIFTSSDTLSILDLYSSKLAEVIAELPITETEETSISIILIAITTVDNDNEIVYTHYFVVKVEDDGSLAVSFHVSTHPDESAIVCLILKEVRSIGSSSKIRVGESYFTLPDGTCEFGKDAFKKFDDLRKNLVITKYERDKKHDKFLMDDKNCYNC